MSKAKRPILNYLSYHYVSLAVTLTSTLAIFSVFFLVEKPEPVLLTLAGSIIVILSCAPRVTKLRWLCFHKLPLAMLALLAIGLATMYGTREFPYLPLAITLLYSTLVLLTVFATQDYPTVAYGVEILRDKRSSFGYAVMLTAVIMYGLETEQAGSWQLSMAFSIFLVQIGVFWQLGRYRLKRRSKALKNIIDLIQQKHADDPTTLNTSVIELANLIAEPHSPAFVYMPLIKQLVEYTTAPTTMENLRAEMQQVETFIKLQEIRYEGAVKVELAQYSENADDSNNLKIPRGTLLQLLAFAYHYGVSRATPWPYIQLSLTTTSEQMRLDLAYNGEKPAIENDLSNDMAQIEHQLKYSATQDYQLNISIDNHERKISLQLTR